MVALSGALVSAHSALGADHMGHGAMHNDVVMCVAVLQVAAFAVAAVAAPAPLTRLKITWHPALAGVPSWMQAPACPEPGARAGPAALAVFRL